MGNNIPVQDTAGLYAERAQAIDQPPAVAIEPCADCEVRHVCGEGELCCRAYREYVWYGKWLEWMVGDSIKPVK